MKKQAAKSRPADLGVGDVDILAREKVYNGFFKMEKVTLKHRLFGGGWGEPIERECLLRTQAVAAVLYDPKHDLIGLIRQFRIGALDLPGGPWLTEVVAGISEVGETSQAVITRELQEEAGIEPQELIPICEYLSSPGGSNETLTLFCALADLSQMGGVFGLPSEGEDIYAEAFPAATVLQNLYDGCFNNAATLICLQWLQANRESLRQDYGNE